MKNYLKIKICSNMKKPQKYKQVQNKKFQKSKNFKIIILHNKNQLFVYVQKLKILNMKNI